MGALTRRPILSAGTFLIALILALLVGVALRDGWWPLMGGGARQQSARLDAALGRAWPAPIAIKPVSDPDALLPTTPDDARKINLAIPLSKGANPSAVPLTIPLAQGVDLQRATDCMTAALYYEAGQETDAGQRGVAQVVLNRVRDPAFPSTVCGVIFEGHERSTGCQFSFTCDGSLTRRPTPEGWERARRNAYLALSGYVSPYVGLSTHYHADYVVPYWAEKLSKTAVLGAHIFYRWPGYRGSPRAFVGQYDGGEPSIFGDKGVVDAIGQLPAEGAMPAVDAAPATRSVISIGSQLKLADEAAAAAIAGLPGKGGAPAGASPAPRPVPRARWVIASDPARVDRQIMGEQPPPVIQVIKPVGGQATDR